MNAMSNHQVTRDTVAFASTPARFAGLVRMFMEDHDNFACFVTEPKIRPWLRGMEAEQVSPDAPRVRIKFFGEFPWPPSLSSEAVHEVETGHPGAPEPARPVTEEDGDFGAPLNGPAGFILVELMGNGTSLITLTATDADWPGVRDQWSGFADHLRRLRYLEQSSKDPDPAVYNFNIGTAYGPVFGAHARVDQRFDFSSDSLDKEWMPRLHERLTAIEARVGEGFEAMQVNFDDLKDGNRALYQQLTIETRTQLERVVADIHAGLLEQGEMNRTLDAVRRTLRHMQTHQDALAPEIRRALPSFGAAVRSHLSLDQKLELTLPLIPGFLAYKAELGVGSDIDLNAVMNDLAQRWEALTKAINR